MEDVIIMPIEQQKICIVLRGLPGVGKTYFAERLQGLTANRFNDTKTIPLLDVSVTILSSDDYFIVNGVYKFDLDKLDEAHQWNFNRFKNAVNDGAKFIIVDNTNIVSFHYRHYLDYAQRHNYFTAITIIPHNDKDDRRLEESNIHNVKRGTIRKMRQTFEWEFKD